MGGCLVLHLDRDGDEPPASAIGNSCTHDLATEAQLLGHVNVAQPGNMERMPINRILIISQIKAQSVTLLAFEPWKACFLPILTRMLEPGQASLFFHAPIVVEGLPKMAKLLFRSALRHSVDPGKLLALDLVVFCSQPTHAHSLSLCSRFFPASQCPVIGVTGNTAGLAKVHLLFWCWIEPDHMRTIHAIPLSAKPRL